MKITQDILYSYLQCNYKGYLKLKGESGIKTDYEILLTGSKEKFKIEASNKLLNGFKKEVLQEQIVSQPVLKKGVALILGAIIENDTLSVYIDGLKKISRESCLGQFSYIPILYHEGDKIYVEQKKLLSLFAVVISSMQGVQPDIGIIVYGQEQKITTVKLSNYSKEAKRTLEDIINVYSVKIPPQLILNDHCRICEFQQPCNLKATKEDNISLLRGISEKEIKKLNRKGIFTITQLSCTFRLRKRGKRVKTVQYAYYYSLQALAIRDKKIYVFGVPQLPISQVHIYFDIEGNSEKSFIYLIGILVIANGLEQRYMLWANNKEEEVKIFQQFIDVLEQYDSYLLFHYGSYESAFLRRMRENSQNKKLIDNVIKNSINILSIIRSNIYFPTFSNGLKDIATYLGFSWSEKNANGIQSIVWRKRWEAFGNEELKSKLVTYNYEDCVALKKVTECIYEISRTIISPGNISISNISSQEIALVKDINPFSSRPELGRTKFVNSDFDYVNKCAYFDYQREKIFLRTSKTLNKISSQKSKLIKAKKLKANKIIEITNKKCPFCDGVEITRDYNSVSTKMAFDLIISSNGIRKQIIECITARHTCEECKKHFRPKRYERLDKHFHTLKSWAIYQHLVHKTPFQKLETMFKDYFNLRISPNTFYMFKGLMASFYSTTYESIIKKITSGSIVHVDETAVDLANGKGYIWVFTNLEEVFFIYKPSREGDFLHDLLKDFKGVLISDFYSGYDSLPCEQQKCLIHLIRDFNDDLLKNPFDQEFKTLSSKFGSLLRSITVTIDKYGLKQRHLNKHLNDVSSFYKYIEAEHYKSDLAEQYQKRLVKNQDKLFTFLKHNGVPWNNNNAEHAIKSFAKYRRVSDGMLSENGLTSYLVLLSIYQTCKYKGINFLKFLLSHEKEMDYFLKNRSKKRKGYFLDIYPQGFPWPDRTYPKKEMEPKKIKGRARGSTYKEIDAVYRFNQNKGMGVLAFTKKGAEYLRRNIKELEASNKFKLYVDRSNFSLAFKQANDGNFILSGKEGNQYKLCYKELSRQIHKDVYYIIEQSKEYTLLLVPAKDWQIPKAQKQVQKQIIQPVSKDRKNKVKIYDLES